MFFNSCRILSLLVIILFASPQLSAQPGRTTFKGIIVDEEDSPITGAIILVLNKTDSVLVQFSSSDGSGAFTLKSVPKGEYLLNFSFLGMQTVYKSVKSGATEEINLGTIKMKSEAKLLGEIQVKADHIPIEIKKDTISYNADAFETQPNAVVEDLLKKLPGIEVQPDGSIKAQGENVDKVLVDGKEFFGDDPKMATKNLPAKGIKKVKVYDKKSDIAEFTGVDDGEREKTIDLQMKEEFKEGLFGKAEGGYGTDDRYMAKASINRFNKTSQLSFLGQFNNINQQGFSFNDQSNFSGGNPRGGGGGGGEVRTFSANGLSGESGGTGLIKTAAGGINFNWKKTKKFNVRSSYFYNNINNTLLQDAFRQNFGAVPFDTDEDLDKTTGNQSHRLAFNSEIKPDSLQEINLNARVGFGNGTVLSESILQKSLSQSIIESSSLTNTDKTSDNFSINSGATYVKKFGTKGHNISSTFNINKSDNNSENSLQALTQYFTTGSTERLDQLQYSISDNLQWNVQSTLTQPLQDRKYLEFGYYYSKARADYDKDVNDIFNSTQVPNEALSSSFLSLNQYHRPGVTFRYSGETKNVNIGLQYQISDLWGLNNNEVDGIRKIYKHFLPRVIYRNDLGNGKNMRVSYTTRINPPSITQLSPVVDNSDPLNLYVGNPDLDAEYNHYVNINYHSFTQFSGTSFFTSLSGNLTSDKIITSRTIDAQLRETASPINIQDETTVNLYASFGQPVKAIHSRMNLNTYGSYTNTQNVINNELLDLNRWSKSFGVSISNLNSKVLEYNLGSQWTLTDNLYQLNDALNQNTILKNYFVDATLTFLEKWKINGNYTCNIYSSDEFEKDQALALLKGSVSRYILPGDKGQIIFSVFDAFDENRGFSRTSQVNYIEEIRSNSIGRYYMLSFVYAIRGAAAESSGSGGMRMRRPGH